MRVLVLSKEVWRNDQNGGNVLSNIFSSFDAKFYQIYCSEGNPSNAICRDYYQITDRMMVRSILKRSEAGQRIHFDEYPQGKRIEGESYSQWKRIGGGIANIGREIVWKIGKWNETEIEEFVSEAKPDIIFAPCYGSHLMIRLTLMIHNLIPNVPIISYISDDFYTLKQIRISPLFWINRLILRRNVRKVFEKYNLVYTMTEEQKLQCEREFQANMKILRKTGDFPTDLEKKQVNPILRIVYAGNIYVNRWKTLACLAKALDEVNSREEKVMLDIYTNTSMTDKQKSKFQNLLGTSIHGSVTQDELKKIYHESDIALHVESFDIINRLIVRSSFSTKITDCLESGCAPMAICDPKQAGFCYLQRNDAAICISNLKEIKPTIEELLENPQMIIEIQKKAFMLGRKNHSKEETARMIRNDFYSACEESKDK